MGINAGRQNRKLVSNYLYIIYIVMDGKDLQE